MINISEFKFEKIDNKLEKKDEYRDIVKRCISWTRENVNYLDDIVDTVTKLVKKEMITLKQLESFEDYWKTINESKNGRIPQIAEIRKYINSLDKVKCDICKNFQFVMVWSGQYWVAIRCFCNPKTGYQCYDEKTMGKFREGVYDPKK